MHSPGAEVLAFALEVFFFFFLIEERFRCHRFRKFSPWSLVAIFIEESSWKSFFGHGVKERVEEKAEEIA